MSRITLGLVAITFLLVTCWQVEPLLASGKPEEIVNNWGINFPWLNNHDGAESTNWLGEDYDAEKVENDLAGIQALGLTRVRIFAPLEGVMEYDGTAFFWNIQARKNLNDFLERACCRIALKGKTK